MESLTEDQLILPFITVLGSEEIVCEYIFTYSGNVNNSHYLALKCVLIFARGYYLVQDAKSLNCSKKMYKYFYLILIKWIDGITLHVNRRIIRETRPRGLFHNIPWA